MHGIIHTQLKKYVVTRLGPEAWKQLVADAGLSGRIYRPNGAYDDADVLALIGAAVHSTGMTADAILQDFGEFIVPDLLELYRSHINPTWKTLEFLENTETNIHRVVRAANVTAQPPRLTTRRDSRTKLTIVYGSPRRLCAVAKGIVRGAARHYGERVELHEPRCMHHGSEVCEIEVLLSP